MTLWFTSDTHFGHKMMATRRGFTRLDVNGVVIPAITDHDEAIITNWNRIVKPDDLVWHLGDVGLGRDTHTLECVSRLNGRKQLITGNHDAVWPGHRNSRLHQRAWLEVFESVQPFAKIHLDGQMVLLSHFPYDGDHTERDRNTQFRLRNEGLPLLHGHLHSSTFNSGPRQLHIGVDAHDLKPVAGTVIIDVVNSPWFLDGWVKSE